MMSTVTILNGPPNCGKDTIADIFDKLGLCEAVAFKDALYQETAKWLTVTHGRPFSSLEVKGRNSDRQLKEKAWVMGMSVRDCLIHVSESIIKPKYGDDFFGKTAAYNWMNYHEAHVMASDGGFEAEVDPVCDEFGTENVLIIRLHRDGCDFDGDSRDYVRANRVDCKVIDLKLYDGDILRAVNEVQELRKAVMGAQL